MTETWQTVMTFVKPLPTSHSHPNSSAVLERVWYLLVLRFDSEMFPRGSCLNSRSSASSNIAAALGGRSDWQKEPTLGFRRSFLCLVLVLLSSLCDVESLSCTLSLLWSEQPHRACHDGLKPSSTLSQVNLSSPKLLLLVVLSQKHKGN